MPNGNIDWDELLRNAQQATDQQFQSQLSGLTRLTDSDISKLISDTGIGKRDLAEVIKIVKSAAQSNAAKADAIHNINKGVNVLVALASKFL